MKKLGVLSLAIFTFCIPFSVLAGIEKHDPLVRSFRNLFRTVTPMPNQDSLRLGQVWTCDAHDATGTLAMITSDAMQFSFAATAENTPHVFSAVTFERTRTFRMLPNGVFYSSAPGHGERSFHHSLNADWYVKVNPNGDLVIEQVTLGQMNRFEHEVLWERSISDPTKISQVYYQCYANSLTSPGAKQQEAVALAQSIHGIQAQLMHEAAQIKAAEQQRVALQAQALAQMQAQALAHAQAAVASKPAAKPAAKPSAKAAAAAVAAKPAAQVGILQPAIPMPLAVPAGINPLALLNAPSALVKAKALAVNVPAPAAVQAKPAAAQAKPAAPQPASPKFSAPLNGMVQLIGNQNAARVMAWRYFLTSAESNDLATALKRPPEELKKYLLGFFGLTPANDFTPLTPDQVTTIRQVGERFQKLKTRFGDEWLRFQTYFGTLSLGRRANLGFWLLNLQDEQFNRYVSSNFDRSAVEAESSGEKRAQEGERQDAPKKARTELSAQAQQAAVAAAPPAAPQPAPILLNQVPVAIIPVEPAGPAAQAPVVPAPAAAAPAAPGPAIAPVPAHETAPPAIRDAIMEESSEQVGELIIDESEDDQNRGAGLN